MKQFLFISLAILAFSEILYGQNTYRPGLFFREDWKASADEIPLSQSHIQNSNLTVQLYGSGKDSLKKSHHNKPVDDPFYVWSGLCEGNWMVTLKHASKNVDLTGFSKIRIRTKQSGLRNLRITLRLRNGNWLVSDKYANSSKDWLIVEFNCQDIIWHQLDADRITTTGVALNPDLSNIEEIGFTDLMAGGKSNACSRLDWIEVYGEAVSR